MNKEVFLKLSISLILICFLSSCSNPITSNEEINSSTLRTTSDYYENETKWTEEIEGNRLIEKITEVDGIKNTVSINPDFIFASGAEKNYSPIYPSIQGFSVLNTSMLDKDVETLINNFCLSLIEKNGYEKYFEPSYLYSLVIFLYDINEDGKDTFTDFIKGEPYLSEDSIQCPVRFYLKQTDNDPTFNQNNYLRPSLDVNLYLDKFDSSWRLTQINFNSDGESTGEIND